MTQAHRTIAIIVSIFFVAAITNAFQSTPHPRFHIAKQPESIVAFPTTNCRSNFCSSLSLSSSASSGPPEHASSSQQPQPTTFREAEVLGLRYMQDGRYEEALKAFKLAMTLPGSRPDIIRKANIAGPSPVGGSSGGTSDKFVLGLDEFEYQAAHYNLACTYACLGNVGESVNNLRKAFEYGFDNYATVRADPDFEGVRGSRDFERLMDEFDPRRGFNPFGVFRK
ncbi:hypothetical protein ACHAWX_005540 [Stephanocyclus meneghinianus]